MSFTEEVRQKYIHYMLRKIFEDDPGFIAKTADSSGISITSVKRYLSEAIANGHIRPNSDKRCGYELVTDVKTVTCPLNRISSEDRFYFDSISPLLSDLSHNAKHIWDYTILEMLNNVIEHSEAKNLKVNLIRNYLNTTVVIEDDGIGIFTALVNYLRASDNNATVEDTIVELFKGKLTTKPENHSGEGIFFSSKMMDSFSILSGNRVFSGNSLEDYEIVSSYLISYLTKIYKIGTRVVMTLDNFTSRNTMEVFDAFSDVEEGFIRTFLPIKNVCQNQEPISRSQARRICNRLNLFKEVILDFRDVEFMGQGFSDEIFRVFALAEPNIKIKPQNCGFEIVRMIKHVGRGNLPANVILKN